MNVATVRARLQEVIQDLTALDAEREALLVVKHGYESLLSLHRDVLVVPDEGRDLVRTDPVEPGPALHQARTHATVSGEDRDRARTNSVAVGHPVHLATANPIGPAEDRDLAHTNPVANGRPLHRVGAKPADQSAHRVIVRTDSVQADPQASAIRTGSGSSPSTAREATPSESILSAPSPTGEGPMTFRGAIAQVMRGAGDAPIASQVILDRARELGGRTEAKKPLSAIDQTLKSLADRDDLPILQVGFRLWRWTGQVETERRLRNGR